MTKEQQDLAWACLPKETRTQMRLDYPGEDDSEWDIGYASALRQFFDHCNLTSDIEPEEMLMIKRKKVVKWYSKLCNIIEEKGDGEDYHDGYYRGQIDTLQSLFGDKYLPDKELEQMFVQVEPKFKVGDKVRIKSNAKDFHNTFENGYAWLPIRDQYVNKVYKIVEIINNINVIQLNTPDLIYWSPIDLEFIKTKDNMEEKELNLCEILKNHEGESFYSPACGKIKLIKIDLKTQVLQFQGDCPLVCTKEGYLFTFGEPECLIFPSKDQRDWIKWDKENNHKTPKTWSEMNYIPTLGCIASTNLMIDSTETNSPIEKSALALLKIHQLIEVGYGGNVTSETWHSQKDKWLITPIHNKESSSFIITKTAFFADKCHIAFYTEEQAEEFLSYPENVQLLKDYFII